MIDPSKVRSRGIIIKPSEVPDTMEHGCRTKLLVSPATGSALTGCKVIYHKPGDTFTVQLHPVSEVAMVVFKGKGEAFVGDFWYEVREGDVIYVPENVKYGTRNPSTNSEDFICYSWQVPYLSEYKSLPGAKNQIFENQKGHVVTYDARAKFDVRIPQTGFIGNVDRGALFTEYGAEMRFIVWPGMGSRKISLHRAKQPRGFGFKTHYHPDSEDTILAFRGRGEGFLFDQWYDWGEGEIMYAPSPIKHGSRNPDRGNGEPFICTGSAAPPQLDLYRLGGYL